MAVQGMDFEGGHLWAGCRDLPFTLGIE